MSEFRWYSGLHKTLDAIPRPSPGYVPPSPGPNRVWRRVPAACMTPRWMARAYLDPQTMESVMVIWPAHYAVRAWHWLGWQWDGYRHQDGWMDRQLRAAYKRGHDDCEKHWYGHRT